MDNRTIEEIRANETKLIEQVGELEKKFEALISWLEEKIKKCNENISDLTSLLKVEDVDMEAKKDIDEAESLAEIVGTMIRQRNAMGISQRELAAMCNMPQSSVARIESLKTTPNLDTILKLFEPLGLALTVSMKRV